MVGVNRSVTYINKTHTVEELVLVPYQYLTHYFHLMFQNVFPLQTKHLFEVQLCSTSLLAELFTVKKTTQ